MNIFEIATKHDLLKLFAMGLFTGTSLGLILKLAYPPHKLFKSPLPDISKWNNYKINTEALMVGIQWAKNPNPDDYILFQYYARALRKRKANLEMPLDDIVRRWRHIQQGIDKRTKLEQEPYDENI